jgi:single-strand DNA-binding protein
MNDTPVTLAGNLAADPDLRFTPTGVAVATLRLAVTPRRREQDGTWSDGETSWYRVTCWRQLAEHAADTLTKGARVLVAGRLRIRQYETDDGRRGTTAEVDADDLGPSLKWATATVTRTSAGNGTPAPASTPAGAPAGAPADPPPF